MSANAPTPRTGKEHTHRITAEILRTDDGETVHRYKAEGQTFPSLEALHTALGGQR